MIERKPLVLGLCTANRCRSQMFEAMLRHFGSQWVAVLSAGTRATQVHPLAIRVLEELEIPTEGLFSKSIKKLDTASDLLVLEDAQLHQIQLPLSAIDQVITLCDNAKESCPAFPARVARVHWGIADPDEATGSDEERLPHFRKARDEILKRVKLFLEVLAAGRNTRN